MMRRISWAVALVVLASACDDSGTVSQLEKVQRRLGERIEERKSQLAKGEYGRREMEVLREKLGEVRHVSTREEFLAKVAALPEDMRAEVLGEEKGALRVRFSGSSTRTRPNGTLEVLRFSYLEMTAFQGDESGWAAEGLLHLSHPCEHPSWDELPATDGLPEAGFLEGRKTRRLRGELAGGMRELAALDAQLAARGMGEMVRLRRCAEGMLFQLGPIQRDSVATVQGELWDGHYASARGRLRREGEVVVFEGRFPGDTRGLPWVREQGPGEWKWEDSYFLQREYELLELRPEGLLKVRRREGAR